MSRRSLRDEMLRSRPAQRRTRPSRTILVVILSIALPLLLVGAIWLLAQVEAPSAGSASGEAPPAESSPGDDAPAEDRPTTPVDEPDEVAADDPRATAAGEVRSSLDTLMLVAGDATGYDRDLFGQAWYDEDGNGCDTRNDLLRRDLREIVAKDGTGGCKVLSGMLDDWYSGTTVAFASGDQSSRLVQIDHIVPLSWAWKHGAGAWNDAQRRAFANDPLNLNATIEAQNASKSDSGPSDWLPDSDIAQCRYVQEFTAVLVEYGLGVGIRDRAMMRGVLDECALSSAFGDFAD